MVAVSKLVPVLFALAAVLAGCTSGGDPGTESNNGGSTAEPPKVEATATTGGIRGVVVDDRIVPIKGALVSIENLGKNMTTAEDGAFVFSGLEPGTYFVKASHPLYASGQASADVVAGDDEPKAVKVQLVRTILAEPYKETLQYDGFIVCSINLVVILSEECGEGAGVPAEECVPFVGSPCAPVPVVGGTRVGGQSNNNVQFDFTVGPGVRTLVVEKMWEPTSEAGKALYSPISTDWSCLPVCDGNTFGFIEGESPLIGHFGNETWDGEGIEMIPETTVVSVFTWASREATGAMLNQRYTDFVTVFYYLPAPEGWSFVNGSPDPFQ